MDAQQQDRETIRKNERAKELGRLARILVAVIVTAIGAGGIMLFGGAPAVAGVSILIALAAFAAGSVLGFLFAVPRVFAEPKAAPAGPSGDPGDPPPRRLLETNTNLERISDWLTTMLVGVGLTQAPAVSTGISQFYGFLAQSGIGCGSKYDCNAQILGYAGSTLLVVGALCGFLFMYLYTRLVLTGLFQDTEQYLQGLSAKGITAVKTIAEGLSDTSPKAAAIAGKADPSVGDAISMMFEALYRPEGFKEVIRAGEQLSDTAARNRADYWFYLTAAYGQAHHASSDASERAVLRQRVLDNARKAVALNASYSMRLWNLTRADTVDDDLQDFASDEDFKRIVGQS